MRYNRSLFRSCAAAAVMVTAALVVAPSPLLASVPTVMNVQGALLAAGGTPVADGNYSVVFGIYKDAVGGNPAYAEGPVLITVKSGIYSYALGSKVPFSAAALANLPTAYLGMKVESDPELPRQPMAAVPFALRASLAEGLECSGCVGAAQLDPGVLAGYAKSATLAKVATSGAFADLAGGPDLSAYAKSASLAKVATSGAYADLAGTPDLSVYSKQADLAKVAGTGKYADLLGLPVSVALGASCGTGLLVQGIKADGSLNCIAASAGPIDNKYLQPDAIAAVSNGLVSDQFQETVLGTPNLPIPDNSPVGVSDTIVFPDIGVAQAFAVTLNLTNSDISTLSVSVFDPGGVEYVLYNKGGAGTTIKTSYPAPTATVSGDLTTWIGKNPKGKWHLKVVDSGLFNDATDGAVSSWGFSLKTLSNKKIGVNGGLVVSGNASIGGDLGVTGTTTLANLTVTGKITGGIPGSATYRWAVWSTYNQWQGWYNEDDPALYGGVNPSTWSDGNAHAAMISPDKSVQQALFGKKGYAKKNSNVWQEEWYGYSSTNSKFVGALFRVQNTTQSDIPWTVHFRYASYAGWSEVASAAINGADIWSSDDDCGGSCKKELTFTVPKNRTSTVIIISASSPESGTRGTQLGFYNDCLALPPGLQFVDDLDTATGGYDQ